MGYNIGSIFIYFILIILFENLFKPRQLHLAVYMLLTSSVLSTTSKQCFEQPVASFLVCSLIFMEYKDSSFQDEEYKMSAFASLADGYLEKPFSLSLLKVRVDAIFKRYYDTGRIFSYKDARVDFESYSASIAGEEVAINAKELEILDYWVKNEGRALTRSQIIDAVWKVTDEVPFDRVIDVYIKELRKKLDLDCILTVRNVGYKLERK